MKKWLIYKRTLDAAHKLDCHDGKCRNLHGHSYSVDVRFRPRAGSVLNTWKTCQSMLMDFGTAKAWINKVLDRLDHAYLNDLMDEPTAEAIASYLWAELENIDLELYSIELMETGSSGVLFCRETS